MNTEISELPAVPEKTPVGRAFSVAFVCEAVVLSVMFWWLNQSVAISKPGERPPIALTLLSEVKAESRKEPPPPPKKIHVARIKTEKLPEPVQPVSPPDETPVVETAMPILVQATATPPSQPTTDEVASFESQVRSSVQAVVEYPPAARMMRREGQARVTFDYLDGHVEGIRVLQTSGMQLLDEAAMSAVRIALLPQAPQKFRHRLLHLSVWVEFRLTGTH